MKRYKKYMFIILSVLLAGGCVQEDINEALRREAELNVRMGKLREWISDTNNEVRLLATIVNTIPTHDYIESVTELPDGSGTLIVFHKGGDILIKNGLTGNKGENGNDGANGENGSDGANGTDGTDGKDGVDGQDGADGQNGSNGTDGTDGHNGSDGQDGANGEDGKDGVDGNDGKDGVKGPAGDTPLLGAKRDTDGNYYWTVQIGGGAVEWLTDGEGNKVIMTPVNGVTPSVGIAKDTDGEYYWQVTVGGVTKWITGGSGEKIVATVTDGSPSIFASVNTGNPEYVVFTMTDGSIYKVAKTGDSKLIFNETGPLFFRRGVTQDVTFDCSSFRQIVKVAGTWDATINYQPKALQGTLTVKAPAAGSALPASERITIEGTDALGNTVRADILVTLYYRIELPKFNSSLVYDVLMEGVKVGEICREYVPAYSTTDRATVVYSYNAASRTFGSGLILENGASIQHDGTGYMPVAGNPSSTAILTEDGSRYVMAADGADGLVNGTVCGLKASLAVDVQGYAYRVVKIGSLYWMGENLKTTQFNDGTPIPTGFATSLDWEIQCGADLPACQVDRAVNANAPGAMQYRNLYGVLYNQFAMKGNIAPQGWHVPSKAELQALVDFVGADARKLKSTAVGKGIGNWLEDTGIEANNLTGFTALPANTINGGNGSTGAQETTGQWWSTETSYRIRMSYKSNSVELLTSGNALAGEGNSIRCVRDANY